MLNLKTCNNNNMHLKFQPATLPVSISETSKLPKKPILKSAKKRNSSSNLLEDSDGNKSSRKYFNKSFLLF